MKLYTEEQMLQAILDSFLSEYPTNANDILSKLTPIILPSDDDICDEAESIAHNYFVMQRNHYQGLEEGAKRMAYWLMKHFKQQENGN
jgi:hypothetical protein